MNSEGSPAAGAVSVGVPETDLATRAEASVGDTEGDWLCVWCRHRVANERDRFSFEGKDEFTFTNPEGIRFQIITFAQTRGCRQAGVPTLEHTWFAGHAWSYCLCTQCGQHLGWYYAGPQEFVGLIKPRIIRAVWVNN